MIAYAPFVTINNSLLRREKLLMYSRMLCATHIFRFYLNRDYFCPEWELKPLEEVEAKI